MGEAVMTTIRKGTRVLFDSELRVYEGTVVSARSRDYLVEIRRTNPEVQEARFWRTGRALLVLDA